MAIPQEMIDQAQSVFKPKMGKYAFLYDWYKNPTIFGITAGSGSNDAFAFSKGDVVNAISFGVIYGDDFTAPDEKSVLVENVKFDASKPNGNSWISDNPKTIQVPLEYLKKIDDSVPVTTQTGINYGQNHKPIKQGVSIILPNPVFPVLTPDVKIPTDQILTHTPPVFQPYVEPKHYLVVQDFIIYSRWENRMGQSGVQELPYSKGGVILLPTATHQDQFDIALKDGKLKELPIVSIVSLVDKQMGKCNTNGALLQTTEYNPCRTVKKGEKLIGYIANGVFTNTNKDIIKPQLSMGEYELIQTNSGSGVQTNSGTVVPAKYDNKDLLMIAGAFLLGYALFSKGDSST